nr:hypothetical protein [Escherichia coli]
LLVISTITNWLAGWLPQLVQYAVLGLNKLYFTHVLQVSEQGERGTIPTVREVGEDIAKVKNAEKELQRLLSSLHTLL